MLVFAQFVFYGLIIAGVFVLRQRLPDANRPYRVLGYPIVPLLFLVFCVGLLINTAIHQPREAGTGLFLIGIGAPIYYYVKRQNASRNSADL
jgi:APA family basic amino acid/polyamine antiporter